MQLDFALERALTTAKAKNAKAVKALLDNGESETETVTSSSAWMTS